MDVLRVRAPNPSPYTLDGTNTWVIGRDPAWVVDPGPALPDHLDAVAAEITARGGAGGIALTHGHDDHAGGVLGLLGRLGGNVTVAAAVVDEAELGSDVPVGASRGVAVGDGDTFGP